MHNLVVRVIILLQNVCDAQRFSYDECDIPKCGNQKSTK